MERESTVSPKTTEWTDKEETGNFIYIVFHNITNSIHYPIKLVY